MEFIYIIIWFAALIWGANGLVSGASHLAKRFGVSELVIWLTVVALWTSMPELVVNVKSAVSGNSELAIANILGSNIANILLILWVSACIAPLRIKSNVRLYDIPFMIFVLTIFLLLVIQPLDGLGDYVLTRSNALLLLLLWGMFAYYLYFTSQSSDIWLSWEVVHKQYRLVSLCNIVWWLIALVYGGEIIVDNVLLVARIFGISERILGITVIAVGTSLPELITSIIAWVRGKTDLAVGNVVWSNILNITLILGVTWSVHVISFDSTSSVDLFVSLWVSILLLFFCYFRWPIITRWKWVFLLWLYIIYMYYFVLA